MSKSTKTPLVQFSTDVQKKTRGFSFVQLAKKHITKIGTKESKTASRDIDNILYGRKGISHR